MTARLGHDEVAGDVGFRVCCVGAGPPEQVGDGQMGCGTPRCCDDSGVCGREGRREVVVLGKRGLCL